jgi:uncharacterized protein (TIGR02118 family)
MHRLMFAIWRKEGMSHDDFVAHYRDVHLPMGRDFAGMVEYDVYPVAGEDGPDAFAIWAFESQEAFEAAMSSEGGRAQQADAESFVGRTEVYAVDRIEGMKGLAAA